MRNYILYFSISLTHLDYVYLFVILIRNNTQYDMDIYTEDIENTFVIYFTRSLFLCSALVSSNLHHQLFHIQ